MRLNVIVGYMYMCTQYVIIYDAKENMKKKNDTKREQKAREGLCAKRIYQNEMLSDGHTRQPITARKSAQAADTPVFSISCGTPRRVYSTSMLCTSRLRKKRR